MSPVPTHRQREPIRRSDSEGKDQLGSWGERASCVVNSAHSGLVAGGMVIVVTRHRNDPSFPASPTAICRGIHSLSR
jgi:hypothetical protein